MPFYAVARGRREGIYTTWAECEQQVKKFSGAVYKKFPTLSEAQDFLLKQQAIIWHILGENNSSSSVRTELPIKIKQEPLENNSSNSMPSALQIKIKQEPEAEFLPLQSAFDNSSSSNATGLPIKIKEELEFLPLQSAFDTQPIVKRELEDAHDDSLLFEDANGDEELLAALDVLKEYPDNNRRPTKRTKVMQNTKVDPPKTRRLKIGSFAYNVDGDGYVDIYIGGHSENIGSWNCMAGYGVYFGKDHPLNVAEAASGRMTRNVGDIEAAIGAIEVAQRVNIPKICLHTSSGFLLNAVGFWMYNWKCNGWRNKDGKVVQNRKQFEKLYNLLREDSIDVKWTDARKEIGAAQCMRGVKKLAAIGTEEYLDKHPSKDDSFAMDYSDYYDYY